MGELTIILCSIHMHMQYLHEAFLLGVGEGGGGKGRNSVVCLLCFACPALPLSACLFFFFFPGGSRNPGFFFLPMYFLASKSFKTQCWKKKETVEIRYGGGKSLQ